MPVDEEAYEREKRRRRAAIKRRRVIRRRRRLLLFVILLLVVFTAVFLYSHKKSDPSGAVSTDYEDDSYMAVGEAAITHTPGNGGASGSISYNSVSISGNGSTGYIPGGMYEGILDVASAIRLSDEPDVTAGRAAVDLTNVERTKRVFSAGAAMEQRAFFTGTGKTVDQYLRKYGEGTWHAIRDVSDDIIVFYEGTRLSTGHRVGGDDSEQRARTEEIPFKISFVVYEDGSFVVREISEDGKVVDDIRAFMEQVVKD